MPSFRSAGSAIGLSAILVAVAVSQQLTTSTGPGPGLLPPKFQNAVGDAAAGRDVYRYETFGNQAFWTDAMQLLQGLAEAKITPLQALQLGLNVNFDALNDTAKQALGAALEQVKAGTDSARTALGDPNVTLSLINQNAVWGVVVLDGANNRKPLVNTGTLNLAAGEDYRLGWQSARWAKQPCY